MEEITCWELIKMYQEGKLKPKDKLIIKNWRKMKKPHFIYNGELYIKNSSGNFLLVSDYNDKHNAGLNFDWAIAHNYKFYVVGDE